MSLRSQQRKALVLSVLMVMLAQSAYSQYYQGWYPPVLEDDAEKKFVNPATCPSETRASGTAINVDGVLGNDSYAGTSDCPMKSLSAAVNAAVDNDEIIMHSGLYHDNVSIDGIDNLVIRAATGATVIFDGTKSITDDLGGVWSTADANGIQEVTLSQDGWQLFLAHEEQVPARWPNAQFSDETVFNRSYMAEGTLTNSNNAYTIGWLTDAGPEVGVHTGLNETINATGLDPVGAIAVMNLGSFRSNSREITGWNSANGTFSYDGTGVGWKSKHHAYFLEGKRELIDADGEWWYNNSDNRLHYKTPSSQDANDLDLRVKVQPFAISVDNSDGVTIQGIDFFGTTVNFNNCDECSFTNSTMQYPSTSKRGLGIAGESEDDRWMTRFYRCTNTFVDKISITNTDGGAIEFHGSGGQSHNNTVNNSYFHAIDWSAADQKGLMTTIYEGGRDMYFTNNSVHLTGASSVLSIGDAPKVFYNRVWDVGHLQTDGAVVQVMQGEAPGAEIAYNWIHDVIKYGARFDAPINEVGEGMNGTMHHNVIWNAAGGLMVKGDYHDIHNNTVFNSSGKNDIIFLTDGGINNKNSTLHNNAVDAMADHRSDDIYANPLPNGSHWSNWNGYLQGYDGAFEARNIHTCAIYENQSLFCWGKNNYGQLGLGYTSTEEDSPQFVDVGTGRTVVMMGFSGSGDEGSGPKSHSCAVLDNGELKCWGNNADGQLGLGNQTTGGVWEPTTVNLGAGRTAISVTATNAATCALLDDQSVKCWGRNTVGQIGLGNQSTTNDILTPHLVNFPGSSKPVGIFGGLKSFCATMDNDSLACWGENQNGQLGLGNTSNQLSPTYLTIPNGRKVISLDIGKHFMCLSYDNGSVACTGENSESQLGLGNTTSSSTLQYVTGIDVDVYRVDAAQKVGCAHLTNGSVVCWGKDEWGLFGYTTSGVTSNTADRYPNFGTGRTAASISVGFAHACAVLDTGSLACWGKNNKAQLGLGNTTQQWIPVVASNVSTLYKFTVSEQLVDPANEDFRPKWGSTLHRYNAGAYDASDSNPWTAGISWTYSSPSAPVAGCMLDYADNYDSDAIVSDGSCTFSSYTPSSSLDLRLHVDPVNSGSYSGSGTDLVDLSTYGNDGTIDGAAWEANRTRFYYDGSCSGATAPANQPGTYVCDEVTFAETNDHDPDANGDWSVSVWMNATTVQHSVIIGKWNGGGSASDLGYIIRIGSDNKLYTSVGTTSGSSAVSTSRISIDEDRWYHLVMVADAGNILRLYADGVNVVNASLSGSGSIRNTTNGISIASYNAGEYNQPFDGNIGEVMIFADALNSTTINQMYNASKGAYSNTTSLAYSNSSYTFAKGQPYNLPLSVSNGDVTTSYTLEGSLPSGMNFGSDNGTIWGTPSAHMTSTTYTVTANNSAGSFSTTISLTVHDVAPSISYSASSLSLFKGAQMSALAVTNSGGAIVSCSASPGLPNGMSLSSTCELSGTPTVAATNASYTITATNTGGSDSTSIYIEVLNSGGALTISPTNREGSVNNTLTNITMSYTHQISNYGWSSGVNNTTTTLLNNFQSAGGSTHWLGSDSGERGEMAIVYARNDSGASTYSLGLLYRWGGTWTETIIDNGTDTGYHPSVTIDRDGALHIAYINDADDKLRYATNASGTWILTTLGNSTFDNDGGRGTAIVVHPITNAVHIVTTINDNTYRDLQYHTNESGSWVNETITNTSKDEGHDPVMAMDSNGNLHVAYYCDNGCSDLRLSSRINGVWQNETIASTQNIGNSPDIVIDSQDTIHIVSQHSNTKRIYLHSGTLGSWTENTGLSGGSAFWPTVDVDSNDSVHISYHLGNAQKDVMYMTNASGSWSSAKKIDGYGGWGSDMTIDDNDDIFIPNIAPGVTELQLTKRKGSGQGLTVHPIYDISPMLPDGLAMNWRNGTIWGTPTEALANTTFTVTVTALGATTQGTFTLYITGVPGDIAYADITGTIGTTITSAIPTITTNSTSGSVTTWAINATPTSGLTFETSNGTIWGTPTVIESGAVFTIWANNSAGSRSTTINITINDLSVSGITYSTENFTLSLNHTMTSTTPSTSGGSATSFAIHPSLPTGLSFDNATGKISGTPEILQTTAVTYTIWANNSGGSYSDQINITINDHSPAPINYYGDSITLNYNQTMTPITVIETEPDLIAAGEDHTCAIKADGTVRCWGEGSGHRLGYGNNGDRSTPTATASLGTNRTAVDITAGDTHTCVVLDDGTVSCWGTNLYGELGDGTTTTRSTPTQTLALGRPAVAIEAGFDFTCALMDNGSIMCWGRNHYGQLGRGYSNSSGGQSTPMYTMPLPTGRHAVAIDIGHYHVCAVLDNGSIACWGPGNSHRLGTGSVANEDTPTVIQFFDSSNPAVDVALGRYSGCGLLENGSVTCWGKGWLGTGNQNQQKSTAGHIWPDFGTGRTAVKVELGRWHNCALLDNSNVKCWGADGTQQMGNGGGTTNQQTPKKVNLASGIVPTEIIAGHWHTCVVSQTYEMYCWGDGVSGKLGDGAGTNNPNPGKVNHFSGTDPIKAHGEITSWAIHPALPTGLSLGSTNGTLYGTPTASLPVMSTYTVYANNSGGSTSFTFNLDVNDEIPNISYSPDWFVLSNNTAMSPTATPSNTGGAIPSGIVDSTNAVGQYSSIAIDSLGYRHISYYDETNKDLKYATDKSGSWVTTTVDSSGNVGQHTSIALDSNDNVHISYYDQTGFDLKYATDESGSWVTSTVDTTGDVGGYTSIAIDSNDDVHISYTYFSSGTLKYATDASGSWVLSTVDSAGDTGYFSSLAIDSNDNAHISYYNNNNGNLKYATNMNGSWNSTAIDTSGDTGRHTSIALDSNDNIHIAYYRTTSSNLRYITNQSGSWVTTTIDNVGDVGKRTYIALDSDDDVHISYWDVTNDDLKYATNQSGSWVTKAVDSNGNVGTQTSLAIDSDDNVHISYYDSTNTDLKYVVLDSSSNVYGYSISPALPSGLVIDMNSGEISGTPTTLSSNTTYTISVRNSGGLDSFSITIEVIDQLPTDISYSPENVTLTNNTVSGDLPLVPSITGSGSITSWELNNTNLPTGISFGSANGTLYGTATELWTRTAYKVWANNSGGSVVAYFNLTVNDELPSDITYTPENITLTKSIVSSDLPLVPSITGSGAITSWELNNTNLPTGISFGSTNGTLYGTATQLWTRTSYKVWANNSGGSVVAYFNLTVNDEVPTGVTYSPENVTLTKNTVSSDLPLVPSITGSGAITSWELNNTNLPTGISFGSTNGTLYGTATQLMARTAFKVWANNSGGSVVAYFNLTVNDQVPSGITYSPENVTLTNNTASSDLPLVPSIAGSGAITSWELNNTNLPSGISFGSANGTLYGTATELWTRTAYKVWANNSGGSVVAYFNLTVNDEIPSGIAYTPENVTLTNNTVSSDLPLVPTITGSGAITSWELNNTNLPSGISFGSANGTLYGTATQLWTTTAYKVWANNTGGTVVAYFNLTVNDEIPSGIAYTPENVTLTNNTASSNLPLVPSITGSGVITSWAINASLPSGLSFGGNNGTIYGTPTELWNRTSYKVWANNSGGSVVAYFNLTVNDQLPTVLYSATVLILTNNTVSSDLPHTPSISGAGAITSWEINATLPSGLTFGTNNGTIYGIPTELWPSTSYTIWGNNSGGSTSSTVSITVNDELPTIVYSPENVTLVKDTVSTDLPLTPAISGSGIITSWELNNTSLPNGISFGSSNGTVYGTATQLWTTTAYKVWANNSGGSVEVYFNLTVIDQVPSSITYTPENVVLTNDTASSDLPLVPSITGSGSITSWELNNTSLPSGITFGSTNGTLYGTATELWTRTAYKVWANNTGGSVVAYFNLTVNDQVPTLSYSPENLTLTKNQTSSDLPLNAVLTGAGAITSWEISPALPSGLTFETSNGTIWGTPTTMRSLRTYTIWANNSGGSVNATVNITVNDELPNISYSPDWFVLTNNTAMSPTATPTNTGGAIPSTTIDSSGNVGAYNSIALDSNGYRHISYSDGTNGDLKYATDASGTWVSITIDSTGNVGASPNLEIDSDDNIHITYFRTDSGNQGIKYATCSSSCSSVSSWTNSTIFSDIGYGYYKLVLSIDSNDDLHLIYYNGSYSSGNLKYATCSSSCATESSWTNITIDGTSQAGFAGIDLVIDSSDHLHVAYSFFSTKDLKYITCSSSCTSVSSWTNISVDTVGEVGRYASIAVDSNDDLHISYRDDTGYGLKYAWCSSSCTTASSWSNTSIANGSSYSTSSTLVGFYSDLAFDSDGHMHITHLDWSNRWLLYSTCSSSCSTNSSWSHSVLMSDYDVLGNLPSLVIDSNDELNIVFYDYNDNDLEFMLLDASSQPYEYSISPDLPTGLSINPTTGTISGIPRELLTNTTFTITVRNSGGTNTTTITIEVLDQLPGLSYSPEDLTLTKNQTSSDLPLSPTLTGSGAITSWAISPALPSGLTFGTSNGTIWGTPTSLMTLKTFTIWANNSGGSINATVNITVNDELPNISYSPDWFVLTNNTAMSPTATPTNSGGAVPSTVIDSIGDIGEFSSIAIDSYGFKHISYFDATNIDIKYATDKTGSWVTISIDTSGNVGSSTSIAIDSNDAVHISYYDATNTGLKYATCSSGCTTTSNWNIVSVDTTGNVGWWTSIAINSNNAVHISYYDSTNDDLKYATCASSCSSTSSWSKVTVDSSGDVGKYSSVAIDSNDAVHISYRDSTNDDLKYATCSSSCSSASSWTTSTIDSVGNVGSRTSIAIDSNDALHISYHDITNGDLKYATDQSGSWANTTVDSVGTVGQYTSIAIDSNDVVHISYYDATNKDLKYATNMQSSIVSGVGGVIKFIDRDAEVGRYSSIAVDSSGDVHISYYGATNGDLKYATLEGVHPWNVYAYSISPSLPAGLEINMNTGEISGTPTELSTNTTYTITAWNTGGSNTTTITIEVIDQLPGISYSPENLTLTKNQNSTNFPLTPTKTGSGTIVSWEINGTLPSGISFGSGNGTLWGVPTELWNTTSYMVWGNNTGGAAIAYLNITVVDEIPNISYSPENLNLTNNTVSSDLPLAPTITGPGDITSWEINATLPSGISFGSDNGTLWGIPTELWPQASYMVWGNNSGGTAIAYLNITVIDQLPTISYSPADLILTNNTNSTDLPLAPTITGPGEIVTWEMNGTLPSGINFGNNNGTFWGVPTELWNQTQYMVWANNTGGSAVAYLNITVVDQLPTLSYVPENLTLLNNTQSPSLPLAPTLSGPGIILEWGISDDLPSGLSFGNDNGTIWGIPTERMSRTTFTIWANNSGGSVNASINITVLHQQPLFNYSVLDLMLVNNTVMNNVTSTVTGGEIVSWEVSPDMPDGIAIGANGNISGLPIVVQNRTMYMIWANNTGGSHVVYLNITIYDIIATLDYIPENLTLTRNESMTDLSPTYSGIVDSWEIHPALPDGLNFTNGTISGTPENNMTRSTYTVYANNTGGSISHTINITVLEPVMEFEYIPANVTLVNNTASTDMPMVPILYNDGVAETWEIWPALPSGLNFSSTNGTISGIATELQIIPVNYTIWANNSGGIASSVISITIVDQLPNLTYPGDLELMNNTNSTDLPMLPILDGAGVIVTWEINATLPAGLNFSSENGSIYGIATELWTKTQYTVWANNSGGSSMAMFNVTVVDQVPTDIGYNHEWLVLTRNENNSGILPLTPNLVGPGAITSWEINGTLPAGLNFSSENGTIWGMPTELYHQWQNITIYANNTGGSVVSIIAIMVNDQIPTISYNLSQVVLKNDTEMDSIEAIHGGGPFITLAIHPQMPDGMYFGYDNATIWGQPTELTNLVEYTIWANNSGGSASTTINITIEDNGPVFDYISTEFTFYVNTEMAELPLTVTSSGGEIQNFSITPQLPAGLSFGELNGTIWGVATQDISKTTFTISAYNPLGVYSIDIDIAVYDYLYGFELDPVWVANDSFMQPIKPSYIIPGATYSVGPDLPEGMSVNPNTGVVSGRPNGTTQLTFYTLIASVDGYTLSVSMKLGVLEDTDLDGMPDEIPPGGNAAGIVEDLDDDNDKVDDLTEIDCDTDPLDAEDKPKFNSNGNCAPEPAGIGFLWCLPMILLLLLLMVLIIATKKKDDPGVVAANKSKPSEKKKGREKWMQDYRIDDDEVEWGEDKEGSWWRRTKSESEWSEWDKAP